MISNLIAGTPVVAGNRASIASAIAAAPFSPRSQTAAQWIATDPAGATTLLNQPTPWPPPPGFPQELIRPNTVLDSATWHTAKHRHNGDFHPATLVHEYLDDLRNASWQATRTGTVIVGIDDKSAAERSGVLVQLGNNGAPCIHVNHSPGTHLLIVLDPQRGEIVTGFPVAFMAVRKGYPYWQNRVEVTL